MIRVCVCVAMVLLIIMQEEEEEVVVSKWRTTNCITNDDY